MRALQIASTGMVAQQTNVEVISNNIANMSTTGYKRRRAEFQDLVYQNLRRVGSQSSDTGTILPSGAQIGLGVKTGAIYRIGEQGSLSQTENRFDLAIRGNGFFQVLLPSGDIAYTRDGTFGLSPEGIIVTAEGYTVQPGITIPAAARDVTINAAGEVLAKIDGQVAPQNVGQVQTAIFANEGGLEAVGDNMLLATPASGQPQAAAPGQPGHGQVLQGFIETSNVNVVQEITNLITAQRAARLRDEQQGHHRGGRDAVHAVADAVRRHAMRIATLALLGLLPGLGATAQPVATLRPFVVAGEATLHLGDLFDGLGPRAAQPIGAAPSPGHRLVLEAAQLQALARLHRIAWQPLGPHERAVVERPGRPVARDEIEAALRTDLLRLGLDPDAELDLGTLLPPMVPPAAAVQLTTEGSSYDPATLRFATTLVVLAEGIPTLRQRLAGRAMPTEAVVVATRRLSLGETVGDGDARLVRQRTERVRSGTAQRLDQVLGQQLRRPMAAEASFLAADFAAPSLVEKNTLVVLLLEAPGLSLTAQGRALGNGPRGGLVPVMNLASRSIVEGQVIGPGRVRVAMGASPIPR